MTIENEENNRNNTISKRRIINIRVNINNDFGMTDNVHLIFYNNDIKCIFGEVV